MKKLIFVIVSLLVIYSFYSTCQSRWKKGIIMQEFIFKNAPFISCHAATIAETPRGLVVAWFGGSHEGGNDVGIWLSRNEHGRWSNPVQIADGILSDSLRYPCWNPVLYQVPNGPLLLFYKVGPNPANWKGWMKMSEDAGITWSAPVSLPKGFLGPIKNKPILLKNGDLICGSSTENDGWKVHFEITHNYAKTWDTITYVPSDSFSAIQPTIFSVADSMLIAFCRSKNGFILETTSYNNGRDWSELRKTLLPNNNSGIDGITLLDGRFLLVYNHVFPPSGRIKAPRTPLNVAISTDNGKNWYAAVILEDSKIGEYSYPSVIQTKDSLIHIVYTWRRKKIKHVVIDPSKLILTKISDIKWPDY